MKTKQITELGLLLALSIIFAYIESLIPVFVAIPGIKLGLANTITLCILYRYNTKTAFFFMVLRVVMAGALFSGMAGIIYGLAGGMISVVVMRIAKNQDCFSVIGVSMAGGIAHNIAQLCIAFVLMESSVVFYYVPALVLVGMIAGFAVGYLSFFLYKISSKF